MANIQSGYLKTKNGVQLMSTNPYPIGAVYISINPDNPTMLFGGTWERMSGGFLYGSTADSGIKGTNGNGTGTSTNASTGNTGSTILTVEQIPSHIHSIGWGTNGKFIKMTNANTDKNSYGFDFHDGYAGDETSGYNNTRALPTGGGKGHSHTLNSHTHKVPYIVVYIWKRIA